MSSQQEQIVLAKELLKTVRHGAMATVNEDGTPHNSPMMFMRSDEFSKIYWGSHAESLHTKNSERTGRVYVVLFDSHTKGSGGIYITAGNAHKLEGDELVEGLRAHNQLRSSRGSKPIDLSFYETTEQNMYAADVEKIEIYTLSRGKDGHISEEVRKQVEPSILLEAIDT